ncbi:MAG: thiosulfate oxidation carrier protein SoxY [Panacagrimonas sp.]
MNLQRRNFMRLGAGALGALATGVLWPLRALANTIESAFKAKNVDEVFKELGTTPTPSDQIVLTTPDIAENGAVVPVSIVSNLPKTEQIMVLVEKNPNPMAAAFNIPEGTEGSINTRVKIGQTCNVYAVVKADGKFYSAMRETKVTLGGCGG